MSRIEKKIWPAFYEKIASGRKKFELRVADFPLSEGDTLVLREWDPETKEYTGRQIEKTVTYLTKFDLNWSGQKELYEKHGLYIAQFE